MARQTIEPETEQPDGQTAVLERMTDILEQLQKNAPPNEPGFGHPEYQKRLREEGFFDEFAKPVYQNGKEAQARGLKPETIERAPKLRPGKYLGGLVEVAKDHRDRIHLMYASVRERDRLIFAGKVRDFDDLIDKIWTEMHAA
jgi:hypothetical protein